MFRGEHLPLSEGASASVATGSRAVRFAPDASVEPNNEGSKYATRRESFYDDHAGDDGFGDGTTNGPSTWNDTRQADPRNPGNLGFQTTEDLVRPTLSRQNTNSSTTPNLTAANHSFASHPLPPSNISPPFSMNWNQTSSGLRPSDLAGPSTQHSEPASKAPSLTEHDAALLLEDMVYDRKVMRDGNTGLAGELSILLRGGRGRLMANSARRTQACQATRGRRPWSCLKI